MKQENGKRAMTAGLRRTMVIFVLDLLCIAGSFFLALWMRFEFRLGAIPQMYLNEYLKIIGPWIVICLVVFQLFRLYNSIWSFVSIDELFRIILAYGVLLAAGLAYVLILKIDMPRSFYFAGFIMSFMSTTALRFSYRFMRQLMAGISTEKSERDRILMIGAGEATEPSAFSSRGKGRFRRKRSRRSSTTSSASSVASSFCPIGLRFIQRRSEATQSAARTFSPSWKRGPSRSVTVHSSAVALGSMDFARDRAAPFLVMTAKES